MPAASRHLLASNWIGANRPFGEMTIKACEVTPIRFINAIILFSASAIATANPVLPSWKFAETINGFEESVDMSSISRTPDGGVEFWMRTVIPPERRVGIGAIVSASEHYVASCSARPSLLKNGYITYDKDDRMLYVENKIQVMSTVQAPRLRTPIKLACALLKK